MKIRIYLLIILFIFLAHISYLPNGFVWLDHRDIEKKSAIIEPQHFVQAFLTRYGETGFYRPLITIVHSSDNKLYGTNAAGFHLTNLLLHLAIVSMLPLFLASFFTFGFEEICLVMLIVGMHPLGWLPVGAISYRAELLVTVLLMLTLYCHSKARTTNNPRYGYLTIISLFLTLNAKETALVLLPAILLLWEIIKFRYSLTNLKAQLRSYWPLFISEIAVLVIYLYLRSMAVPEIWNISQTQLSFSETIGTHLYSLGKLLLAFLNPLKPNLSDAVPIVPFTHPVSLMTFAVLLLLPIAVFKKGIKNPFVIALSLFFILISPALGIVPVPRLGSPHYGYIALLGFSALFIFVIRNLKKRVPAKVLLSCLMLFLSIMSVTTYLTGTQFKNDFTLFTPEVKRDPNFFEGYFYLGNYHTLNGEYEQAGKAYQKALQTNQKMIVFKDEPAAYTNLAYVMVKEGKINEADSLLLTAQKIASPQAKYAVMYNRALLAAQDKNYIKALALINSMQALSLDNNQQMQLINLKQKINVLDERFALP